jgi:hypothetical protein
MHRSALFLDRDGVINVDHGYVHRPDQFVFVPGIFELARFWTNELHRPIVVVTNQSGIGRGYFNECAHADLTRWIALKRNALRSLASITAVSSKRWYRRVSSRSSLAQTQSRNDLAGSVGARPRSRFLGDHGRQNERRRGGCCGWNRSADSSRVVGFVVLRGRTIP